MIIKPYSTVAAESFVAADYPCVQMFFPVNETSGATLTDAVGGGSVGTLANHSFNGTKVSFTGAASLAADPVFGSVTLGSSDGILFAVADLTTSSYVHMQDSGAATVIKLGTATASPTISDGSGSVTIPDAAPTVGVVGHALFVMPGTSGEGRFDSCTASAYTAGTLTDADVDITTMTTPMTDLGFAFASGGALYGIAFFKFTTIPADYKAAIAWMTAEWQLGNKVIYPGWKGLS